METVIEHVVIGAYFAGVRQNGPASMSGESIDPSAPGPGSEPQDLDQGFR